MHNTVLATHRVYTMSYVRERDSREARERKSRKKWKKIKARNLNYLENKIACHVKFRLHFRLWGNLLIYYVTSESFRFENLFFWYLRGLASIFVQEERIPFSLRPLFRSYALFNRVCNIPLGSKLLLLWVWVRVLLTSKGSVS